MEKVRPWCGQPSDRGRLRNRTEEGQNCDEVVRAKIHENWFRFLKCGQWRRFSAHRDIITIIIILVIIVIVNKINREARNISAAVDARGFCLNANL